MTTTTRLVVACCNRLVGDAIARILTKKTNYEVVSTQAAVPVPERLEADVLVLDSLEFFPDDSRGQREDNDAKFAANCVLVAMEDSREQFLRAIQRGVRGYVLRDACAADVLCAIRAVAEGHAACPPSYMGFLFDYVAARVASGVDRSAPGNWILTRREQQLVPLLDSGLTNKEIANSLHLSEQTVKNHIYRIMRKMNVSSRLDICEAWREQSPQYPRYRGTAVM